MLFSVNVLSINSKNEILISFPNQMLFFVIGYEYAIQYYSFYFVMLSVFIWLVLGEKCKINVNPDNIKIIQIVNIIILFLSIFI